MVSCTFPGFSAGSYRVHVRTRPVRTGKLNIPHSGHLSGYRPILSHAALNKQHLKKCPSLRHSYLKIGYSVLGASHPCCRGWLESNSGGGAWSDPGLPVCCYVQKDNCPMSRCARTLCCVTCVRLCPSMPSGDVSRQPGSCQSTDTAAKPGCPFSFPVEYFLT